MPPAAGKALRLKPAEAAIAKLADDTPLTEDQAATLLGLCQAAGIPAAESYPTLRALALAGKLHTHDAGR